MSDTPKWTPGPWVALIDPDNGSCSEPHGIACVPHPTLDAVDIVICAKREGWGTETQLLANARLISSAPDLYEALEALVEINDPANFDPDMSKEEMAAFFSQCDKDTKEALALARRALAKARGDLRPSGPTAGETRSSGGGS